MLFRSLLASIKKNGLDEPLTVEYSQEAVAIRLIEGNHRLVALLSLGCKTAPCRVIRRVSAFGGGKGKRPALSVYRVQEDRFGYVRGDLKPSEVGMETFNEEQG